MLIRSQDKRSIVNLNNIDTICTERDETYSKEIKEHYQTSIRYFNGWEESMGTLGTYSTEEKAIKVLDMIQKAYCVMRRADCLNTGTVSELAQIRKESREEIVNELGKVYVFQMPSDEEVPND